MENQQPRKSERTIEELMEFTNEQLFAMSPEELKVWMGDALLAQEEILKSVPRKSTALAGVVKLAQSPAAQARARAVRDSAALLPDDMQKIMRDAQAMLDKIKGLK